MEPETKYAKSGEVNIAYQVVGDGPFDLVLAPGYVSHVEYAWEEPMLARFLQRLGSISRLIMFDKRGTGLSDPVEGAPTLDERMDDVRAVMDAVGSEQAALFGYSEGGPICALFAATYPQRASALIMYSSFARLTPDVNYASAWSRERLEQGIQAIRELWATEPGIEMVNPSMAGDQSYKQWFARLCRLGASPAMAEALMRMNAEIDIRDILPAIRVPTLIMHRVDEAWLEVGHSWCAHKSSESLDRLSRVPARPCPSFPPVNHAPG